MKYLARNCFTVFLLNHVLDYNNIQRASLLGHCQVSDVEVPFLIISSEKSELDVTATTISDKCFVAPKWIINSLHN